MTEKPENPDAFPSEAMALRSRSGMSLRDHFAGQAIVGMKASETPDFFYSPKQLAEQAYEIADALLVERNKS